MKQQRVRFKSRKKFIGCFNAQFKKLTAGFVENPQAATDRSKQHKSASFSKAKRRKSR